MTDTEAKELLDLARKCAAGDAQTHELLQRLAVRCHQNEANTAKLENSNARLTAHVGRLSDEVCMLRAEFGGDEPARAHVRKAAYAIVQRELEAEDVVGVEQAEPGEWRVLVGHVAEYTIRCESLIAAVDEVLKGSV